MTITLLISSPTQQTPSILNVLLFGKSGLAMTLLVSLLPNSLHYKMEWYLCIATATLLYSYADIECAAVHGHLHMYSNVHLWLTLLGTAKKSLIFYKRISYSQVAAQIGVNKRWKKTHHRESIKANKFTLRHFCKSSNKFPHSLLQEVLSDAYTNVHCEDLWPYVLTSQARICDVKNRLQTIRHNMLLKVHSITMLNVYQNFLENGSANLD